MKSSSKASLFLIELIIVIAFFAVASAVCIELFAHSNSVSRRSHNLNMAITVTQSAAECFRTVNGDTQRALELLPDGASLTSGEITVFYDKNWQPALNGDYRMLLRTSRDGPIMVGDITVLGGGDEEIYSLRVECYAGSEVP